MRTLSIFGLLALAGCLQTVDPCADQSGTCLSVHIDSSGPIDPADELLVRVRGDGVDGLKATGSPGGTPVALPAALALLFPAVPVGAATSLQVEVTARSNGAVLGGGTAAATVRGGEHASAQVALSPATDLVGGAPSVAITAPGDDAYTNGMLDVVVAAQPAEVDRLELLIDDVLRDSWQDASPFTFSWDTRTETEGAHVLIARATSGSVTVESPPRTITVDRSPPSVTSRAPAPGSRNVDTLVPLTIGFSEPMAPPVVGAVTVSAGGSPLQISPVLSPDGLTLSIKLVEVPLLPADLTVTLSTLTDRAGNPLPPSSDWTVTAPAWLQLGTKVGDGTGNILLAAGGQGGDLLASYASQDAQNITVVHVHHWDGAAWTELGTGFSPVTTANGVVYNLALAVDPTGAPLVLLQFMAEGATTYSYQVMSWSVDTWVPKGPPFSTTADAAALAADANGNLVIAYTQPDATASTLYSARFDGASWASLGPPVRGSTDPVDAPSVVLDSHGDAVVSYRERQFGSVSAWVLTNHQGSYDALGTATWTGINAFPGSGNDVGFPVLAIDHADHPLVAFPQQGDTGINLYVWRWDTAAWIPLDAAAPTDVGTSCALAVDPLNRPIALYHDSGVRPSAYVVRWEPSVSRWVPLGAGPVAAGLRHSLTIDGHGRAVVGAIGTVFRSNQ